MANSGNQPQDITPYMLHTQQEENTSFRSKTDDIFGSLGGLEKKYQADLTNRKDDDKKRSHDDEEEEDSGMGSRFKKPSLPSQRDRRSGGSSSHHDRYDSGNRHSDRDRDRGRSWDRDRRDGQRRYDSRYQDRGRFSRPRGRFHQPDYKLNPDKWKKYTLEDTATSDSQNRSVALDFINELRKRKAQDAKSEEVAVSSEGCAKIEFHKPETVSSQEGDESSEKRENYGDVYRMSEYVIGMAKKPKARHHTKSSSDFTSTTSNLALNHLAEEDMDSDETMATTAQTDQSDSKEESSSQSAAEKVDSVASSSDEVKEGSTTDSVEKKTQFKFGKGKGKRKIRARQADEDD